MPCLLAMIDVRKTPTQVALAFVLQLIVHFFIDFVLEPVVFGISVEIHSAPGWGQEGDLGARSY